MKRHRVVKFDFGQPTQSLPYLCRDNWNWVSWKQLSIFSRCNLILFSKWLPFESKSQFGRHAQRQCFRPHRETNYFAHCYKLHNLPAHFLGWKAPPAHTMFRKIESERHKWKFNWWMFLEFRPKTNRFHRSMWATHLPEQIQSACLRSKWKENNNRNSQLISQFRISYISAISGVFFHSRIDLY